jgi:hypothetical protein
MKLAHYSPAFLRDMLGSYLDKNFTVEDAKKPLDVMPLPEDANGAIRLHPMHCVLAHACKRVFGFPALVYRGVAYVVHNRKRVLKYQLSRSASVTTEAFDLIGDQMPAALAHAPGLRFVPPHKGRGVGQGGRKLSRGKPTAKATPQQRLARRTAAQKALTPSPKDVRAALRRPLAPSAAA